MVSSLEGSSWQSIGGRVHPLLIIIGIMIMSLGLSACGGDSASGQGEVVNAPVLPTADPANQGLVARVNGEAITQAEFDEVLTRYRQNTTVSDDGALMAQVLDSLIEQRIINQSADNLDIGITDEEVQAEIDALKASIADDESAWQDFLALNNLTDETFFLAQRESLLTQRLRDYLLSGLDGDVMQVRARHILVGTEAEANQALTRLQSGEPFSSVALQVSLDITTNQNGGELGWFTPDELMDARLADVAFSLEPNQVAGPIATRIGYHVIQTLEKGERPIEAERLPMLMESVFINWLNEQFSTAQIERYR